MTINTTTTKQTYVGNGVTTAFPVAFAFYGADELQVVERTLATGAEVVKQLTTHYTVSGGNGSTGTVNAVAPPPASVSWTIARMTARTQLKAYPQNDPFPSADHERALDRLTAQVQELEEKLSRALTFALTDPAASVGPVPAQIERVSKLLGFDLQGRPIATSGSSIAGVLISAFMETLLDDVDAAAARATLGTLDPAGANTFTATQTFQSVDAGAAEGPVVVIDRSSASPAVNDLLGALRFDGRSSTAVSRAVAKLLPELLDATNASEDARLLVQTIVAGTLATRLAIGQGLVVGAATGGDQGVGSVNATAYFRNGAALPAQRLFVSAPQTFVSGGLITVAHGLAGSPSFVRLRLRCLVADAGWTPGEELDWLTGADGGSGAGSYVPAVYWDATNVYIRCPATGLYPIVTKSAGVTAGGSSTNWALVIHAFG